MAVSRPEIKALRNGQEIRNCLGLPAQIRQGSPEHTAFETIHSRNGYSQQPLYTWEEFDTVVSRAHNVSTALKAEAADTAAQTQQIQATVKGAKVRQDVGKLDNAAGVLQAGVMGKLDAAVAAVSHVVYRLVRRGREFDSPPTPTHADHAFPVPIGGLCIPTWVRPTPSRTAPVVLPAREPAVRLGRLIIFAVPSVRLPLLLPPLV